MLLSLFQWIESTTLARSINESLYAYASIQAVHLLSLAVVGGAVLLVDLRILGLGMRNQSVQQVARVAWPWLLTGTIGIIVTGTLMFSSLAASKYYWNEAYWWKMYLLGAALVVTFGIRQRLAMAGEPRASSVLTKVVAAVSALLWLNVGVMGRAIAFI